MIKENASYEKSRTSIRRDRAYCKIYHPSILKSNAIEPLVDKLSEDVRSICDNLNVTGEQSLVVNKDAWGLVYEDEESCGPHGHGRETPYSGVYYLECTEGCGSIYFPQAGIEIEPKKGDLVLFGSLVVHGVMANTIPNSTRICLAFNVADTNRKKENDESV